MKIISIKKVRKDKVINLTVHKNHTFVTEKGFVTHNCDNMSPVAQMAFRGFTDEFSGECAFIFTGNYKDKIIPQLLQRFETHEFETFKKSEMVKPIYERLSFILDHEHKEFKKEDIVSVINTFYPSVRAMIGAIQRFSVSGVLDIPEGELDNLDKFTNIMSLIKNKKFADMILAVNEISAPDAFYGWAWKNVQKYFEKTTITKAVPILAKYQDMASRAADKHLNLGACCTELMTTCEIK